LSQHFYLSSRNIARAFWENLLLHSVAEIDALAGMAREIRRRAELRRAQAKYNTGSISLSAQLALMLIGRYFRPSTVAEIGTFIGTSLSSIACAVGNPAAEFHSCDISNDCFSPPADFPGRVSLYPYQAGTAMLQHLAGQGKRVDLFFVDGRLSAEDVKLMMRMSHESTLYLLDDTEGSEKGVVNLLALRPSLPSHLFLAPCPESLLRPFGVIGRNSIAVLMNPAAIVLTAQQEGPLS
jgi:hypothetical protein